MKNIFFSVLIGFILLFPGQSLYFLLTEGKEKCIHDSYPKHEDVLISFNVMDDIFKYSSQPNDGVKLSVYDSLTGEVLVEKVVNGKGILSFNPKYSGNHKICFITTTSHWFRENQHLRFEINVKMNQERSYEKDVPAHNDHLHGLFNISKKISKQTKNYVNYQKMARENEDLLFEENEKINQRVILATGFQIILVILSGVYQIFSLRSFFISKKLI